MKHDTFIAKLGNPEEVAATLARISGENVTRHAMRNWGERTIPKYIRPFVVRLAEQRGVSIPKDLKRYASQVPAQ